MILSYKKEKKNTEGRSRNTDISKRRKKIVRNSHDAERNLRHRDKMWRKGGREAPCPSLWTLLPKLFISIFPNTSPFLRDMRKG